MPERLRWPQIARALARHDPVAVLALLRERLPRELAGEVLLELTRTMHGWPKVIPRPARKELSPRELQVLACAAAGLTNEQTAERLACSYESVKSHRRMIALKLDTHNVLEAVAVARERGLLP